MNLNCILLTNMLSSIHSAIHRTWIWCSKKKIRRHVRTESPTLPKTIPPSALHLHNHHIESMHNGQQKMTMPGVEPGIS